MSFRRSLLCVGQLRFLEFDLQEKLGLLWLYDNLRFRKGRLSEWQRVDAWPVPRGEVRSALLILLLIWLHLRVLDRFVDVF